MIPMNTKMWIIDKHKKQVLMITNIKEAEQPSIAGNPPYKIIVADLMTVNFANASPVCTAGRSDGPKSQPRLEWEVNAPHGSCDLYESRDDAMTAFISLQMGEATQFMKGFNESQKHIKKAWMTLQAGK